MWLFRDRDDIYAHRWQNKQGRSGYSVACHNGINIMLIAIASDDKNHRPSGR